MIEFYRFPKWYSWFQRLGALVIPSMFHLSYEGGGGTLWSWQLVDQWSCEGASVTWHQGWWHWWGTMMASDLVIGAWHFYMLKLFKSIKMGGQVLRKELWMPVSFLCSALLPLKLLIWLIHCQLTAKLGNNFVPHLAAHIYFVTLLHEETFQPYMM